MADDPPRMTRTITFLAGDQRRPLPRIFHDFGYANADFTYTPPTRRLFDHLASYADGCRFLRLHNIFSLHGQGDRFLLAGESYGNPPGHAGDHDRVFSRQPDGRIVADWSIVDRVYDQFLAYGFRPIVECCFVPSCLQQWDVPAGERSTHGRSHVPQRFDEWQECVRLFVEHVRDRYGTDEIRRWWWEIYNEPDAVWHWRERPERFMALYDHFAAAVKGVDPALLVGGPAVKQDDEAVAFFEGFLAHCQDGVNHATGALGAPLDFISVHCKAGYPEAFSPDLGAMFGALARYRRILDERFPAFAALPFINDESDIVWAGDNGVAQAQWLNFRNRTYFPAIVVKMVDRYLRELLDAGVDLTCVDSDNCHIQWERSLFAGNRCQLTPLADYPCTDLLRKPIFNAYVLLARLREERWPVTSDQTDASRIAGVIASGDDQAMALLAYHAEDGLDDECDPRRIDCHIPQPSLSGPCMLVEYRLDRQHGSSYDQWQALGRPHRPDAAATAALRQAELLRPVAPPSRVEVGPDFRWSVELPMHGIALLLVVPVSQRQPAPPQWRAARYERSHLDRPQAVLTWQPDPSPDFFHYRVWRRLAEDATPELLSEDTGLNTAFFIDSEPGDPRLTHYAIDSISVNGTISERSAWRGLAPDDSAPD